MVESVHFFSTQKSFSNAPSTEFSPASQRLESGGCKHGDGGDGCCSMSSKVICSVCRLFADRAG